MKKSTTFFGTQSFMLLAQQSSAERTTTVKFATIQWLRILNDVTTQVTGVSFTPVKGIHVNNGENT